MTKELKPCAKCGGEPEFFYRGTGERRIPGIRCKKCGHKNIQFFWNEERVIEVWNTWYREDGDDE